MGKPLVGHHLMRVRIRKNIFERLRGVARLESDKIGEHVTVSDLVRVACYNYLIIQESLQMMESAIEESDDDDEDEEDEDDEGAEIVDLPMLN